jgi:hypothetical protein
MLSLAFGRSASPDAARQRTRLIAADEDLITEEHLLMEMEDSRLYGTEAAPLHSTDPMFERPGINSRL